MFAALSIEDGQNNRLLPDWLAPWRRKRILPAMIDLPKGNFLLLTAQSREIDWEKVERLCGRAGKRLLLPAGIEPPPQTSLRRFSCEQFKQTLLLNTCTGIIAKARLPLYRKIVTLLDRQGRFAGFVPQLLCHCITVRVITAELERYAQVADTMMEELGANILVSDYWEEGDSIMIFAPDAKEIAPYSSRAPVFTAGDIDISCSSKLVGDPEVSLQGRLAGLVPKGIDPLDFAGVLYEERRWPGLETMCAQTLRCGQRRWTSAEIAVFLAEKAVERGKIFINSENCP